MHRRASLTLVLLAALTALPAQGITPLQPSDQPGVARSMPVPVTTYHAPDGRLFAAVGPMILEMASHSNRSPRFQVLVQQPSGRIVREAPRPVRTLRGGIFGMQGAQVAASLLDDGLYARIITPAGDSYWVEPDRGARAPKGQHMLYRADDSVAHRHECGTAKLPNAQVAPPVPEPKPGPVQEAATKTAEIACDADFEYFTRHGSSTANVVNRIESVLNTMNLQYESEVDITHQITTILIRTSSSQPYTSTDALTLLNQFLGEWTTNQTGIHRDIAHMFTGKNIDGGTIGIAYIGVICNPAFGYGLVESDFNNNFACATDLSAHELGHNWNAQHCGCPNHTMNSFITCANSFNPRRTRPVIAAFRDSLPCLDGQTGTPTSVSAAVQVSTQNVGGGSRRGQATVVVTDDLGNGVAGASVTGSFSGDFNEGPITLQTGGNGSVTFVTSGTAKGKINVTFCVSNVTAALTWSQAPGPVCGSN